MTTTQHQHQHRRVAEGVSVSGKSDTPRIIRRSVMGYDIVNDHHVWSPRFGGWFAAESEPPDIGAFDDRKEAELQLNAAVARMKEILAPKADAEPDELSRLRATVDACRAAGFIDGEGKACKLLGRLVKTKDGAICGVGGKVWTPPHWTQETHGVRGLAEYSTDDIASCASGGLGDCYSSQQAAEAARREGGAD